MPPRLTSVWEQHKNSFLSHHSFNSLLDSAIKRIERKMNSLSFIQPKAIERFREESHLPLASAKWLICLCITNQKTRAFAPAYLFLAGEQAMMPPEQAVLALNAVKAELRW